MADMTNTYKSIFIADTSKYTKGLRAVSRGLGSFAKMQVNATKAVGSGGLDLLGKSADIAKNSLRGVGSVGVGAMKQLASSATTTAKAVATIGVGAGVVGLAAGIASVSTALDDYQRAISMVGKQTNSTTAEMGALSKSIADIYAQNLGESMQDVASVMGRVKQSLGGTSSSIKQATKEALALRDAFPDMDIERSVSAVKKMTDVFDELNASEAYNMIAEGAKRGLDTNGDLLDTMNEYSRNFKDLGLNAEDMFGILSNGMALGVRDTDYMADAVKEFGIRIVDGSASSAEGLRLIGMNNVDVARKIKAGGETARATYLEVTKRLANMQDPLKQNQAAVDLFGTKVEDMGIVSLKALSNTDSAIKQTTKSLKNVNNIKIDSFGDGLQAIGRILQKNFILPIGTGGVDSISKFANNLDGLVKQSGKEFTTWVIGVQDKMFEFLSKSVNGMTGLERIFNTVKDGVVNFYQNAVPALISVTKTIGDMFYSTIDWYNNGGQQVFANIISDLGTVIAWALETGSKMLDALLGVNDIDFGDVWDTIKDGFESVLSYLSEMTDIDFIGFWNGAEGAARRLFDTLSEIAGVKIDNGWDAIKLSVDWMATKGANGLNAVSRGYDSIKTSVVNMVNATKPIVTDAFEPLSTWWNENGESMKTDLVDFFKGIAAVAADLASRVGGINISFNQLSVDIENKIPEMIAAMGEAGRAMQANPEKAGNWMSDMWDSMKDLEIPVITPIFEGLLKVWNDLTDWWDEHGADMFNNFKDIMRVLSIVTAPVAWIIEGLADGLSWASTGILDIIAGIVKFLSGLVTLDLDKLMEGLGQLGLGLMKAVLGIFTLGYGFLANSLKKIAGKLGSKLFGWIMEKLNLGQLTKYVEDAMPYITKIWDDIVGGIKTGFDKVVGWLLSPFKYVGTAFKGLYNTVKLLIPDALAGIRVAISQGLEGIAEFFEPLFEAFGKVTSFFADIGTTILQGIRDVINGDKSLGDVFEELGDNLMNGFVDGVMGAWNAVKDSVVKPIKSAVDAVIKLLDIHSPSRVFKQIGEYTMEGYNEGVDGEPIVVKSRIKQDLEDSMKIAKNSKLRVQSDINRVQVLDQGLITFADNRTHKQNIGRVQPANINVSIGKQQFTQFVDDISTEQGKNARNNRYRRG